MDFAKLPKPWLIRFSQICPGQIVTLLALINKRCAAILRTNEVWSQRAQLLEAASKYPASVFTKRQADPHFWYKWCRQKLPKTRIVTAPRLFKWKVNGEWREHHVPRVGCLLVRGTSNFTEVYICTKVNIPSTGKFASLPKSFVVSRVARPTWDTIAYGDFKGVVWYTTDKNLKVNLNDEMNPTAKFVLLSPKSQN